MKNPFLLFVSHKYLAPPLGEGFLGKCLNFFRFLLFSLRIVTKSKTPSWRRARRRSPCRATCRTSRTTRCTRSSATCARTRSFIPRPPSERLLPERPRPPLLPPPQLPLPFPSRLQLPLLPPPRKAAASSASTAAATCTLCAAPMPGTDWAGTLR